MVIKLGQIKKGSQDPVPTTEILCFWVGVFNKNVKEPLVKGVSRLLKM